MAQPAAAPQRRRRQEGAGPASDATTNAEKVVRIGCSSAFWGDSPAGAWQLVHSEGAALDYLVADYLAEVTMAILARSKSKTVKGGAGEGGFVNEFVETVWKPLMGPILAHNIKVVTNAGGMNPLALKKAIEQASQEAGQPIPIVAAVYGDDLLPRRQELLQKQQQDQQVFQPFFHVEAGEAEPCWHDLRPHVLSFNAYLGAVPIAAALKEGAQIVVTGRCADSALVLGPLLHEFGWNPEKEYDLLSSGSLAGHIIECGCQATGGNFTDWKDSLAGRLLTSSLSPQEQEEAKRKIETGEGWTNVGFPIAEVNADGSFIITKARGTGGLVSVGTVCEQLVYEIHDPANYILPDVICDWTSVTAKQLDKDRVLVSGARGKAPTPFYKISATSLDGFKLSGTLMVGGIDAKRKAEAVGNAIVQRSKRMLAMRGLPDFISTNIEILGAEHTYGPHAREGAKATREVILSLSAHHNDMKALAIFGREVAPAATGMAPGITGGGSGRPRPQPLIRHSAVLVRKEVVPAIIAVGPTSQPREIPALLPSCSSSASCSQRREQEEEWKGFPSSGVEGMVKVPLVALCFGRSGDKGDVANVGIIARRREYYPFLKRILTSEVVHEYFAHLVKGKVVRYELPGIHALNFVLTDSLAGGGLSSLNIDRQGKAYAQMLLSYEVTVPKQWIHHQDSSFVAHL
ncbi:Terpene utilization protein AtuA [Balamuthia mandrillaris]